MSSLSEPPEIWTRERSLFFLSMLVLRIYVCLLAKVLSFFLTGDLERDIVIFEPLRVESMLLVAMDSCSLSLAKLPYCVARPYMS